MNGGYREGKEGGEAEGEGGREKEEEVSLKRRGFFAGPRGA